MTFSALWTLTVLISAANAFQSVQMLPNSTQHRKVHNGYLFNFSTPIGHHLKIDTNDYSTSHQPSGAPYVTSVEVHESNLLIEGLFLNEPSAIFKIILSLREGGSHNQFFDLTNIQDDPSVDGCSLAPLIELDFVSTAGKINRKQIADLLRSIARESKISTDFLKVNNASEYAVTVHLMGPQQCDTNTFHPNFSDFLSSMFSSVEDETSVQLKDYRLLDDSVSEANWFVGKPAIHESVVPTITTEVLTTTTEKSTTSKGAPITTTSFSTTSTGAPITTTSLSTTSTEAPITTTSLSTTSTGAPITTTSLSTTSTEAPITTTSLSTTSTEAPTTEKPITTTRLSTTTSTTKVPETSPPIIKTFTRTQEENKNNSTLATGDSDESAREDSNGRKSLSSESARERMPNDDHRVNAAVVIGAIFMCLIIALGAAIAYILIYKTTRSEKYNLMQGCSAERLEDVMIFRTNHSAPIHPLY